MTDIYNNRPGVTQSTDEKAQRAVRAFRAMQPMLSAYARVITGKPHVRVEMSAKSNGATDGKRIFFRPPIELGDNTPHIKRLCDKRDDTLTQLCPACAIREGVLVTIYHEIGHIAYGTFKETSDDHKANLLKRAVEENGSKYATALERRIKNTPSYMLADYQNMSSIISPFLPMLINNLEDARINAEVFKARKGTRVMFRADVARTMEKGVPQADPSVIVQWREYPLNQQVMVASFLVASGYEIDEWLAPQIVRAFKDAQLRSLLSEVASMRSVSGIYELSFKVLARLRQLGYLKNDKDPDHEPEEDEENDDDTTPEGSPEEEDEQQEGDDGDGADGDSADSGTAPEDAPESDEAGEEAGDDGASGDSEGDPSEPEGEAGGSGDSDSDEHDDSGEGSADHDADDSPEGEGSGSEDGEPTDEEHGASDQSGADSTGGTEGGSEPEEGELNDGDADGDDSASREQEPSDSAPGDAPREDGDAQGGDGDPVGQPEQSLGAGEPLGQQESDESGDAGDDGASDGDAQGSDVLDVAEGEPDERTGDGDAESSDRDGDPAPDQDGEGDRPIDTGADEGLGGIELIDSDDPDLPMGEPDEITAIHEIAHPEDRPTSVTAQQDRQEGRAIEIAVIQGIYFETASRNLGGVREHRMGDVSMPHPAWDGRYDWLSRTTTGADGEFSPPESVLGPALMHMRVAFSDNKRAKEYRHRKSGKIDGRVLGKRAHSGDERLFKKHTLPGKRDYFVLIGIDVSGSTIGENIALIKRAAMAQAELCSRLGVKFAVYAHSGDTSDGASSRRESLDLDIYHIKDPEEPWNTKVQERLLKIGPDAYNLDGHTIEFYRRVLDTRTETDRVIMYYTDGKMPAENHDEELEILQREIKTCKKKNYTLMGVGIRTDSPVRHGLDTVQVDDDADLVKVVKHLEKRLLA